MTMIPYNRKLKQTARNLRNNMTDSEIKLWSYLRMKQLHGYQFYRQKIIDNYIVDFYCHKAKLVIEVDGGQHYTDEGKEYDADRNACLNNLGLNVLHISNMDVLQNIEGVVEKILDYLSLVSG